MLRRLLPVLPLAALAGPMAAQACQEIRLAPGASAGEMAGEVAGEVAGGAPPCYALALGEGERARIQVVDGDVVFGIDGVIERQEDYAFRAERGTYRIRLAPQGSGGPTAPFALRISLAGAAQPAPGGWRLEEGEARAAGLAWIAAPGGPSLALHCARARHPRAALVFDGPGTAALVRAGDAAGDAAAWIEIDLGAGPRRHPVRLARQESFDPYWEITEGLSRPLLEDFAAGSAMRLLDAEGATAAEVGLAGSARVRAAIARQCGL